MNLTPTSTPLGPHLQQGFLPEVFFHLHGGSIGPAVAPDGILVLSDSLSVVSPLLCLQGLLCDALGAQMTAEDTVENIKVSQGLV